ncbi:MAG: single-stranded-DNA-specific exonuclease RecJ [Anaerofustis sp.]
MDYKIIKRRTNLIIDEETIHSVSEQFRISELSAELLLKKGFSTFGQIEEFLFPKMEYLNNPMLFSDMEKTVKRIRRAISSGEKIAIYGDYDCDGVCSAVILYKVLTELGGDVIVFLPNRFEDGYGMNMQSTQRLIANGTSLIITVDNGIVAFEEIDCARNKNVDVIVTDHHTPSNRLPNAYSIINPKIQNEKYPYSELCGAGVALKLAESLYGDQLKDEWIVFAGIATIADIVPLTGENRTITSLALNMIQSCENLGLTELIRVAGFDKPQLSSGSIAFQIAPRINAVGRLLSAQIAFQLFTAENVDETKLLAQQLDLANSERKNIEEDIFRQADLLIEERAEEKLPNIIFVKLPQAHEGVIGIVAGKICEKYNRPTVICSENNGEIKASARSIAGINIYKFLDYGHDLYLKFGGHEQAAGFSISSSNYQELVDRVTKESVGLEHLFYKKVFYDLDAVSSQLSERSVRELGLFAPYGIKNPHPVYLLKGASVRNASKIGSKKEHLKANIVHNKCNFQSVGFFMGNEADGFEDPNQIYDILFTPSINTYRQNTTIQLELKEIAKHVDPTQLYYHSLYQYFITQYESNHYYTSIDKSITDLSIESVLSNNSDKKIYVLFDEDTVCRVVRYADAIGSQIQFAYNDFMSFTNHALNIWVNPIRFELSVLKDKEIVILDKPNYFSEYPAIFSEFKNLEFLKTANSSAPYHINRNMIAFIYKKLRYLDGIGNQFSKFIAYLNQESEYFVNYFTVRICLDVLSEMDILEYEMIHEKIYIEFKKITEQKDVFASSIMIKLMGI